MVVKAGPYRRQNTKEFIPSNLVLEKSPEMPLENKEVKLVNLKGDQP